MTNRIRQLNIALEKPVFFDSELNSNLVQRFFARTPIDFYYNGGWRISHYCCCCESEVSFGMIYNPEKYRFPVYDYKRSQRVCEKYYSKEIVTELYKLLNNVELCLQSDLGYLVQPGKFIKEFPVSSSILLINYECKKCGTSFLGNYEMLSPIPPDRGMKDGKLGSVKVSEIIEVGKGMKHFKDLIFNPPSASL